jgi:hypothetical protein
VIGISLAAMRKIILAVLISACVLGFASYGWLFYISRDARKFDAANIFVTFHSALGQCEIRTGAAGPRHALPCGKVESYIRDDLRLPLGATFAVSDLGNNGPEIASLAANLKAAGYRSVRRIKIAFITEPERPAKSR